MDIVKVKTKKERDDVKVFEAKFSKRKFIESKNKDFKDSKTS